MGSTSEHRWGLLQNTGGVYFSNTGGVYFRTQVGSTSEHRWGLLQNTGGVYFRTQVGSTSEHRRGLLQNTGGVYFRTQVGSTSEHRWGLLQNTGGVYFRTQVGSTSEHRWGLLQNTGVQPWVSGLPLVTAEGEIPVLSCSGRALSLGMSSGTRARGCPRTTAAARHTCLMRGPPRPAKLLAHRRHDLGLEERADLEYSVLRRFPAL